MSTCTRTSKASDAATHAMGCGLLAGAATPCPPAACRAPSPACWPATVGPRAGIVPRSVKYLFNTIRSRAVEAKQKGLPIPEFSVSVSFLELYRSTFYDLFDAVIGKEKAASNIKILDQRNEDGTVNINISNVTKVKVDSVEELME